MNVAPWNVFKCSSEEQYKSLMSQYFDDLFLEIVKKYFLRNRKSKVHFIFVLSDDGLCPKLNQYI